MKTAFIKNTLLQIPPEVRYFLKRAIFIFIIWQSLYYIILFPLQIPDRQLTQATAWSTGFLYQNFIDKQTIIAFKNDAERNTSVYINDKASISIADSCNGLGLYVLYVGILFCFNVPLKRKIIFAIVGCISIFILNGLRCFLLAWLYLLKVPYFNFAHHYVFALVIYVFIFFMWTIFIKKMKNDV